MPPTPNLSSSEWLILGELCSVNGFTTMEIWHSLQDSKLAPNKSRLRATLAKLKAMQLARSLSIETDPLWLRTSDGDLAYNWKKQLGWPDPGPEPRSGETGNKKSPMPVISSGPSTPHPGIAGAGGSAQNTHRTPSKGRNRSMTLTPSLSNSREGLLGRRRLSAMQSNATKTSDALLENLLIAILAVNNYSILKAVELGPALMKEGLLAPAGVLKWPRERVFDALISAGYRRGNFIVGLITDRILSLMEFAASDKWSSLQAAVERGDKAKVEHLLCNIRGVGPVVVQNFWSLQDSTT